MIEGVLLSGIFIFLAVCMITLAIHAVLKNGLLGTALVSGLIGSGSLAFGIAIAVSTALKMGGLV